MIITLLRRARYKMPIRSVSIEAPHCLTNPTYSYLDLLTLYLISVPESDPDDSQVSGVINKQNIKSGNFKHKLKLLGIKWSLLA